MSRKNHYIKSLIYYTSVAFITLLYVKCGKCYIPGACGDDDNVDISIADCDKEYTYDRFINPIAAVWFSSEVTEYPPDADAIVIGDLNIYGLFPTLINGVNELSDNELNGELLPHFYYSCDVKMTMDDDNCDIVQYCRNMDGNYQIQNNCEGFKFINDDTDIEGIDLFPNIEEEILTDIEVCGRNNEGITFEFGIDKLPGLRLKMGLRP